MEKFLSIFDPKISDQIRSSPRGYIVEVTEQVFRDFILIHHENAKIHKICDQMERHVVKSQQPLVISLSDSGEGVFEIDRCSHKFHGTAKISDLKYISRIFI